MAAAENECQRMDRWLRSNIRLSGPHMDKVPASVIDGPRAIDLRAAAQLWR
jgi:hypothetical protein